jgi:Lon protease-like protein
MERPDRIPLFPLDVVLLPAMTLPLHIFEPRYKIMIRQCLDRKIEFGIVLAAGEKLATVGCTGEIMRKVRDYPDGRMDIVVEGRSAFRLNRVLDEKEYSEGIVEYLPEGSPKVDAQQEAHLMNLFEQCHLLLFGGPWTDGGAGDEATIAYRMAAQLPLELQQRQELLEMRNENERRELLDRWIAKFLPYLERRERSRQRAGGNGQGLN